MIVAADGPEAAVAFRGGVVVVRAAEFLAGARGTLEVADPDAQATSGKSVWDSQTAASLASAADTLSIPFSALPLKFGLSYRIHVFYRCTGSGLDDDKQRLTGRRLFAWGFKAIFGSHPVRARSAGITSSDALKKTLFSIPRPWFGVTDLTVEGGGGDVLDFAYQVASSETLSLAVFKTEGTGAVVIDQIVFLPAQESGTDSPHVFDDQEESQYLGWQGPYPDHVVNAHDETDMHQGGSIACYARAASVAGAEQLENDPAKLDLDFALNAEYEAYVLAAVHLPQSALLIEDHFQRTQYPDWGTGDSGDHWTLTTVPEYLAAVLKESDVPTECVPKGVWAPLANYEMDDLVEGSDGRAYFSVIDSSFGHPPNQGFDPVTDGGTHWRLAAGDGDTAFLFPHDARSAVTTEWFGDMRVTVRCSSQWVYMNDGATNTTPVKWSPWAVVIHDGSASPITAAKHFAQAVIDETGNLSLRIVRSSSSGAATALSSYVPVASPYAALDKYWIMFEKVGTALRAKMWKDGTSEPDWQIEVMDQTNNDVTGVVGEFGYVFGRIGLHVGEGGDGVALGTEPAGLSFTRASDGSVYGNVRFDEFKVEAAGGFAEAGHVALTLADSTDLILGPEPVPANRNWVWLHLGRTIVWPSPGVRGLDVVAWNPESAPFWQAIGGQASFWAETPAAPIIDISFRAERT